jgi:hypothetical protein
VHSSLNSSRIRIVRGAVVGTEDRVAAPIVAPAVPLARASA